MLFEPKVLLTCRYFGPRFYTVWGLGLPGLRPGPSSQQCVFIDLRIKTSQPSCFYMSNLPGNPHETCLYVALQMGFGLLSTSPPVGDVHKAQEYAGLILKSNCLKSSTPEIPHMLGPGTASQIDSVFRIYRIWRWKHSGSRVDWMLRGFGCVVGDSAPNPKP